MQVNLTLIHFNICEDPGSSVADTWKALEEAQKQGLTVDIGVSHFKESDIEALMDKATVLPAVNQCELSVVNHDDATIEYCTKKGIVYQSYSPLCGGFNGSSCTWSGGKNVMSLPDVIKIAKSHNVSPAQVGQDFLSLFFPPLFKRGSLCIFVRVTQETGMYVCSI